MPSKAYINRWLPPVLLECLKPLLGRSVYYSGHYPGWTSASAKATGYNEIAILQKVRSAALMVQANQSAFERDSVLFGEIQHSFPVLAGLLRAAVERGNQLSVLDFGGALGSSYYQCRGLLSVVGSLKWSVVEQANFVACGRAEFENEHLNFYYSIAEAIKHSFPDAVLLSSVLQYVENPWEILDELMSRDIDYILIDRTPFCELVEDVITVQHVPPRIYKASYPCRIFSRQRFSEKLGNSYEILASFDSADGNASVAGVNFKFGGMILRRK